QDKVSGVYSEYQPTDGDLKGGELKDSTTMASWEYRDGDAVYNLTAPAESLRFRGKLKSG
ncbi:hypothetical protein BMETH_226611821200, partial [methanotrophic bacterial endosymbiont of Bathymodiolus sp.]